MYLLSTYIPKPCPLYTTYCLRASFPILECTFTVFQHPLRLLNDLSCFRTSFSCFQTFFLVIEQVAYFVVNRYVTTYINLIQLLTWGATNQDMSLFMKSRLRGCYKTRHVTKRDVLVLATLRYSLSGIFPQNLISISKPGQT